MAIATGTAAVIGAGIAAGAGLGAAKMQSNAQKRAAAAQRETDHEALDYQRGRDTVEEQRYQKRLALYNQYVADYRARNGGGGGPSMGGGGGSAASGGIPVSIADLVGSQQGVADATLAPSGSVADTVGGVFDWKRYGA